MERNNVAFCPECLEDVSYVVREEERLGELKGANYTYLRKMALCSVCHEELDVYLDENIKALYDAYRAENNLISLEKIREIPTMYGIGKRMLSLLLGWGEQTFSRYYDGHLPTRQYSDVLKKLHDDPSHYRTVLEEGRRAINEATYRKSKLAIQKLLSVNPTPIMKAAGYLCSKKEDLSNLRLQKLLYYVQGVSASFRTAPLFQDQCEAWVNGPVYREIYHKFKDNLIDEILGELLGDDEKEVIDCVLECFGRYDGDTLTAFTHNEEPWIMARGDLPYDAPSTVVIPLESIKGYFVKVRDKNSMTCMSDMKLYAQEMLNSI
jgi:uncharacterized phage-associated protein